MNRLRLTSIALIAAFAAAALPAAARAQGYAPAKPRKFVVYVKGTQVSNWSLPYNVHDFNCYSRTFASGGGSEVVKFRSVRPQRLSITRLGPTLAFHYGVWNPFSAKANPFGLHVKGTTLRDDSFTTGSLPGPCGGGSTSQEVPFKCSTLERDWFARLTPAGGGLMLELGDNPYVDKKQFEECPTWTPAGVNADGLSEAVGKISAKKLMRSNKTIVIKGKRDFQDNSYTNDKGTFHEDAHVTWQVRLKPVK